jgi:hypothetical protein
LLQSKAIESSSDCAVSFSKASSKKSRIYKKSSFLAKNEELDHWLNGVSVDDKSQDEKDSKNFNK